MLQLLSKKLHVGGMWIPFNLKDLFQKEHWKLSPQGKCGC